MALRQPVTLRTERLILRPFCESDWREVHEYAVDPEISKFQEWGPNSPKDTQLFVSKCIVATRNPFSNTYFFSITLPGKDKHIGGCVLESDNTRENQASIGYTLARQYWNRGYATEAAEALLRLAFVDLNLCKVTANCDSENIASWRVMEKIGMNLVTSEPHSRFFKRSWRSWLEYAVEAQDWLAKQPTYQEVRD